MASTRHSDDDEIQPVQAGGTVSQSIVELLSTTSCGLIFWSRHPFEVAAELQLRVHASALPVYAKGSVEESRDGWLMKRGLVVQCQPARRADGSVGFQVSLLFIPVMPPAGKAPKWPLPPVTLGKGIFRRSCGRSIGLN